MDELDIGGKQYISTRRAGKEHGYHSDYIGQLIRGKKVAGQKVGRAWYVDAASLAAYLGKAYATPESKTPVVESVKPLDTISTQPKITSPIVTEAASVVVEEKVIPPVEEFVVAETVSAPPVVTEEKITAAVQTQERAVPIQTINPNRSSIATPREEKVQSASGLRYIADDAPLLPHVQIMQRDDEVSMAQAAVVFAPQKRKRAHFALMYASAAVFVIVLAAGASAYLSSVVQVAGETASAYYAIEK